MKRSRSVGTGVIGASWAAQFLAHGHDVVATDPAPGAEERLRADVAAHWPVLEPVAGRLPGPVDVHGRSRGRGRRGGLRAGERPGARGRQARPLRRAGRGRAPRRGARLQLVGDAADRDRARLPAAPGTRGHRAPVQPAPPHPAGRGRARGEDRRGDRRAGAGVLRRGREEADPAASGAAGPRREPAAGRALAGGLLAGRAGRGHCGRHRHRDLPRSRPAMGGDRPVPQPAPVRRVRAASRTTWSTSGRPSRRGGATSARSPSPRSSSPSWRQAWTTSWRASIRPS